MGYFFFFLAMFIFVAVIFVREIVQAEERKKKFRQSLYDGIGMPPKRKYTVENMLHIPGYYQRHKEDGQLDDITWNDLNMDDVFKRINYTHSATGEEYLYYMLRSAGRREKDLVHLEEVVSAMTGNQDRMVQLQVYLSEMGYTGKHSLYDYIENLDTLGERGNFKHYLADALYIPLILLAPFQLTLSITGIAVLSIYQIVSYFKDHKEMEPYIISFAYIMRLIGACEKVSRMELPACEGELAGMKECIQKMQGVRRGSFWVFTASDSRTSGNPLELIMDYIRMIFHLDLIIFNTMLKQLRLHVRETDELISHAGFLEAAVSVSMLRASLKNGWCAPDFIGEEEPVELLLEKGYHILLEDPVENSISASRGVLLTGSNASGKSTFLKMVALNAVLAQTLHTCTAGVYRAPVFKVYSSMTLRDDLAGGESYYIVEIKALKRILDAVRRGEKVLCFVDEVLRGTNTVERIAASTQILKSLSGGKVLCFAATHDIELTELLQEDFDNYHFEEEIRDGDIFFAYRLMPGKATTRNAIRLLELIGYSADITDQAFASAQRFLESGTWQA